MIRTVFSLLFVFTFIACGDRPAADSAEASDPSAGLETVMEVDDFGDTLRYGRRIADGVREGRFERINGAGVRIEEGFYRNDSLDGPHVFYYSSGDTLSVEHYERGSFEGEFRQYYENGRLQQRGRYVDNTMTGQWYQYYDTGELMEVVTFADNEENGPFTEYFRNGNLKAEGNYRNGDNEHGLLLLYDESGRLVRKMNCEDGVCRTIWTAE